MSIGKNSRILGIDPGVDGALAYVERDSRGRPVKVLVQDILMRPCPYAPVVDTCAMSLALKDMPTPDIVLFEEPFAVYASGGKVKTSARTLKVSLVNFGRLQGVIEAATGITDWHTVAPSVWKKALGLSSHKGMSLALANEIFPFAADLLTRKGNHNRAEALLLAEYAHWHLAHP